MDLLPVLAADVLALPDRRQREWARSEPPAVARENSRNPLRNRMFRRGATVALDRRREIDHDIPWPAFPNVVSAASVVNSPVG